MAINEQIEDLCFCLKDIHEVTHPAAKPETSITSVSLFRYSYSCPWLESFHDRWKIINSNFHLRNNLSTKDKDLINKVDSYIRQSPTLDQELALWRGVSIPLDYRKGEIMKDQGFIWTSLDKNYARVFSENDTSACYSLEGSKLRIDLSQSVPCSEGTLIKILIPPKTHLMDLSYYNHMFQEITSEIVLPASSEFIVTEVSGKEQTWKLLQI